MRTALLSTLFVLIIAIAIGLTIYGLIVEEDDWERSCRNLGAKYAELGHERLCILDGRVVARR